MKTQKLTKKQLDKARKIIREIDKCVAWNHAGENKNLSQKPQQIGKSTW